MLEMKENIRLLQMIFLAFISNPRKILKLYSLAKYVFYKVSGKTTIVAHVPKLKAQKMVLDLTSHMDRGIFLSGLFGKDIEDNLTTFLLTHTVSDAVFFDVGANSGYFSLLCASLAKKGSIHSFEPVPKTYKNFVRSISLNNIHNIFPNNLCIGAKEGYVTFYIATHSDVSSLKKTSFQESSRKIRSRMTTLSSYCKKRNIKKIDIMKIDTEGNEKDILMSSKKLLMQYKPILIVEFSNKTTESFGYHPNELYDYLSQLGYRIYAFKEHKLIPQKKKEYYKEDLYCFWRGH